MTAETFPVGEYLSDEVYARGWSVDLFAGLVGLPVQMVVDVVEGRCAVSAETASRFGAVFGTSAELWLRLQEQHRNNSASQVDTVAADV